MRNKKNLNFSTKSTVGCLGINQGTAEPFNLEKSRNVSSSRSSSSLLDST